MRATLGTHRRARRGAALAVVLVALVVVAALGAGTALASRELRRAAHDDLARQRAESSAEGALESALHPWDRRRSQLAVGAVDSTTGLAPGDVVRTVRIGPTWFLVEADARAAAAAPGAAGWAERSVSALVHLRPPSIRALAAITSGGPLTLLGNAAVDGHDATPSGWTDCIGPAADTAAVATPGPLDVHAAPQAFVSGALLQHAATVDPSTYAAFGVDDWTSLAARADVAVAVTDGAHVPLPDAVGASCVLGAAAWSDPSRGAGAVSACATTYPLVLARGGLALDGGRAQGVLLVDGDLVLNGVVTFAGVIVVRGALHADAGALHLDGALLVSGGGALGAGSHVRFSRCAVARALDGVARVGRIGRRSWAEVTR